MSNFYRNPGGGWQHSSGGGQRQRHVPTQHSHQPPPRQHQTQHHQGWHESVVVGGKFFDLLSIELKAESEGRIAIVHDSDLYFALDLDQICHQVVLFDPDHVGKLLGNVPLFVKVAGQCEPSAIPPEMRNAFSMVVLKPPKADVKTFRNFAKFSWALLKEGGKVIVHTSRRGADLARSEMGLSPTNYCPSQGHVLCVSYASTLLSLFNPAVSDAPRQITKYSYPPCGNLRSHNQRAVRGGGQVPPQTQIQTQTQTPCPAHGQGQGQGQGQSLTNTNNNNNKIWMRAGAGIGTTNGAANGTGTGTVLLRIQLRLQTAARAVVLDHNKSWDASRLALPATST